MWGSYLVSDSSVGFDKHIMSCIHHYNIIQHSFNAPKTLSAFLFFPLLFHALLEWLGISGVLAISPSLSCQEIRIVGVIENVNSPH